MLPSGLCHAAPICFERRGDRHLESSVGLSRPPYLVAFASDSTLMHAPPNVCIDTRRLEKRSPPKISAHLAEAGAAPEAAVAQQRYVEDAHATGLMA